MKWFFILTGILLMQISIAFADVEGPKNGGGARSSDQGLGSLIAWQNVSQSTTSDDLDSSATCALINGSFSEYLIVSTYGFTLPNCSSITQIDFKVEKNDGPGHIQDNSVKMVLGGSVSGDEKAEAGDWNSTDFISTYTWTASLPTCAQVKANDFGVGISATRISGTAPTATIDNITATITFNSGSNGILTTGVYWGGVGTK